MPSVFEIGLLAGMLVKMLKRDLELVEYKQYARILSPK